MSGRRTAARVRARPRAILRIGRIPDLNMFPVRHGLDAAALDQVQYVEGAPAQLNAQLLTGRLDASVVSSAAFIRARDRLMLLPSSITAPGPLDSVVLFSRVPMADVRSVAVTPRSETSVALLRLLLPWGTSMRKLDEVPERALRRVDGVLLIGDDALAAGFRALAEHRTDLAEQWRRRTGRPMVFAVWAVRRETARSHPARVQELSAALVRAQARHLDDPAGVAAAAARRYPFTEPFIASYLRQLRFSLGIAECVSLDLFASLTALERRSGGPSGETIRRTDPSGLARPPDATSAPGFGTTIDGYGA
jgi:chorismate dehydratase